MKYRLYVVTNYPREFRFNIIEKKKHIFDKIGAK